MSKRLKINAAELLAVMVVFCSAFFSCVVVRAEGETARFGSESYEWVQGTESPIGVYIESDEPMSYVHFNVQYDSNILEFVSGGDLTEEGTINVSSGVGQQSQFSIMICFVPLRAGNTQITITDVLVEYSTGVTAAVVDATAPISIPMAAGTALSSLTVNGQSVPGFSPSVLSYSVNVANDVATAEIEAIAEDSSTTVEISNTTLAVGDNLVTVTTTNSSGNQAVYTLNVNRAAPVSQNLSDGEGMVNSSSQTVISVNRGPTTFTIIMAVLFIILVALLICLIKIKISISRSNRRHKRINKKKVSSQPEERPLHYIEDEIDKKNSTYGKSQLDDLEVPEDMEKLESFDLSDNRETEIEVRHVTMEFKREKDEATSIKELFVRTLKGQRKREKFKALDDVSFVVKKGDVVGIIGTNGSGKSTILKIISGVLQPTKGTVIVDKSKIQLLTLGTGFDYELTGRENVYLNGAIIGYSKEYIDEKYDDIVKFAELEGFMEQKVRNYSSGMVSRLGFAIATIRDTPEILILDEVLSVGDMFFRKKSNARIKEMMRGGSTVLIVSHSTSVIKENCNKAVWIEKGVLKAVGDPTEVCRAYERKDG